MLHKVKVTVLDKKLFPELQTQFCAVPDSGKCPCYHVGDEFVFYRNDERDDYWHMGTGTLIKSGIPDEGVLISPGTQHCGEAGVPFCSEAWDAISRYIYTGLQGGAIMHGWMNDDRVMIACCNDGTRPVIFKIERIDYCFLKISGIKDDADKARVTQALKALEPVSEVNISPNHVEVDLSAPLDETAIQQALSGAGPYQLIS